MKIIDVDRAGASVLEIDNTSISRRRLVKAIASIPGVKITRRPSIILSWLITTTGSHEEFFCEFEMNGDAFYIFEPFGDSNVYVIAQRNSEKRSPNLARIKDDLQRIGP